QGGAIVYEDDISAEEAPESEGARLQKENGYKIGKKDFSFKKTKGQKVFDGVSGLISGKKLRAFCLLYCIMKITENTESLKRNADFRRVYRRGRSESGGYTAVYALKNRRSFNRLGVTVGKPVGKAVVRSRVKRLLR